MSACRGVMIVAGGIALAVALAWGQGAGSIGMGWCPVCGKDMPQSHFPHQVDTGGGGGGGGGNIFADAMARHRMVVGWYNDGVAAYNRGQYAQAEQLFRQVIGSPWVFLSDPWRMLGLCLEMQGRQEEALKEYNTACAHGPLDFEAHRLRNRLASRLENKAGDALAAHGKWAEAREKYRKAVALDSTNQVARDNLTWADRNARHDEAAVRVQRIVNGLAVEVAAPAPSAAVKFVPAGEWMFQKGDVSSAPVDARSRWVARAPALRPLRQAQGGQAQAEAADPKAQGPAQARGSAETLYVQYGLLTRHKYTGGWPGPVDPDPRLPNPLDPRQIAREEALAGDLDRETFHRLDLVQALAVLSDRYYAAANRAARATGQDLEAELAALRQGGRIPAAGLLGEVRTDPAVAAAVDEAVRKVCRREAERVKAAGERFTADLAGYLSVREGPVLRDRKASEIIDRLLEDKEQAVHRLRQEMRQEIARAHEALRKEGLWGEGEDPYAKAVGDVALQGRLYDVEGPIWRRQFQKEADLNAAFLQTVRLSVENLRKEARP